MNKGLTLIELVVSMAVIVLITGVLLSFSRANEADVALLRSAQRLALDFSRQQNNALSVKEFQNQVPCGYGIHFDSSVSDRYFLFADIDPQHPECLQSQGHQFVRVNSSEDISVVTPEPGIVISSFSHADIVFKPPMPELFLDNASGGTAEIILASLRTGRIKKVIVTSAGQISIQ